jgi:succinate dehydrogenase/fumarate reductase flavoprotein subunit
MFKYDEKGENARRAVLADAVVNEFLLGNGPIYVDLRHLPKDELDHMEATLQVDRYTMPAYYEQKKLNFREDLVEISVSEFSIRRSGVYFRGSGLAVDTHGETSIEGLFAGGDCATVSGGIAGAAVLGHIAGEGAVQRINASRKTMPDIDLDAADAIRAEAMACLERPGGMAWRELEDRTRQTVTDYVGVRRTSKGLKLALDTLHALAAKEPEMRADDLHGLMRVHEAKSIRLCAELMATTSLTRKETRTRSAHRRLDYPETDDANWRKFIIVERGANGPAVSTLSTEYPLSHAFGDASEQERASVGV